MVPKEWTLPEEMSHAAGLPSVTRRLPVRQGEARADGAADHGTCRFTFGDFLKSSSNEATDSCASNRSRARWLHRLLEPAGGRYYHHFRHGPAAFLALDTG